MKIKFIGAAREVTGSKHLITTDHGKTIMLDCGMFQGKGLETDSMNRDLGCSPENVDYIILTHAHIDHSGLIPYMYRMGFRGSVVCTNATRDLCALMLVDSAFIQENDTKTFNKKRIKRGLPLVAPIYTQQDALESLKLFIGVPWDMKFMIDPNIKVRFTSTGHMLGSSVANIEINDKGVKKRIAYTGDIGRATNMILAKPVEFPQADYIITESTYGDRLHKDPIDTDNELVSEVVYTCLNKKGKLIIPSFSVGRTQEIVYSLNNAFNDGRLPRINIYVDSPLAVNATSVFRTHTECFNEEFRKVLMSDSDPFGFKNLFYITRAEDSKRLNNLKEPCVIISASGMMEAGRIKHHLANNISEPKNTVLAVGYCAPSTLGARILSGVKEVSIHGTVYPVKAQIRKIDSFSGHADYKEMIDFLSCQDTNAVQKLFLVHGEYEVQLNYAEELKKAGFTNIAIPSPKQEFIL